jgi:Ca-activated chloride channel family protein
MNRKNLSSTLIGLSLLLTLLLSACGGEAEETQVTRVVTARQTVVEAVVEKEAVYASEPLATLAPPNDQPYADVFFENYGVNPVIDTEDDHLSTFAMDVDTASYTVMRRFLRDGHLPDKDSVRVEEYINYFLQDYPPPAAGDGAFSIHLDGAPAPFGEQNYHLLRVGIQGYRVPQRKDASLVFVIDVSGSMDMENRLGLVKRALHLLVRELRPSDTVGIVVYGSQGRVIMEPTLASGPETILAAIDRLQPEGSTNAEEGLVLGYKMAAEHFKVGGINRVILCSDGVANVGRTGADSILAQIRDYAAQGITLSSVGFGMGNYNDVLMEQLADDGDGNYAYVDTLAEAERVFVENLTGTLQAIAKDAKIQVDFDPAVVSRYRLIGYENRDVADEDFRNDDVDAGEVGAGHSVTALYEVKFHPDAQGNALTVYVRYEDPDTGEVSEIARSLDRAGFSPNFAEMPARFRLAAAVAEYAELLRHSYWSREGSLGAVLELTQAVAAELPNDPDVAEFAELVAQAKQIAGRQ